MLENISKTNQPTNKQYYIYYFIYMIISDPTTIYNRGKTKSKQTKAEKPNPSH